jgi:AraC-like DNA-binding protein/CheY-like chemotaxis protein
LGAAVTKIVVVKQIENGPDYSALIGQCFVTCSAEEVEKILEATEVALVIMECNGDTDSSIRILRDIKNAHPSIPVIFVVESSTENYLLQAFKGGIRDYFRLPLDPEEFLQSVAKILSLKENFPGGHNNFRPVDEMCDPGCERSSVASDERLVRAVKYINRNYSMPLCLDDVAKVACMSKYHFCRVFKKHFGMGPIQYLMSLRIKNSMSLLNGSNTSITLIAFRSGFKELSEFNKQFKKTTGLTPTAYRNSKISQQRVTVPAEEQ